MIAMHTGLPNASDTLAAAIYYVDFALTMIQAGVSGVNFHDSWCSAYSPVVFPAATGSCFTYAPASYQSPHTHTHLLCLPRFKDLGSCPDVCGQQVPPMVTAPFYGMLFVQMALAQLPKMLLEDDLGVVVTKEGTEDFSGDDGGVALKAHVLRVHATHELRVVLIRKDGDTPVNVEVDVAGDYGPGSLSMLTGPSWTAKFTDITLAGQTISQEGELQGERVVAEVAVEAVAAGSGEGEGQAAGVSRYRVTLLPASVGLLVIRPRPTQRAQH
ncbi:hypothetical protein FOA52_005968 [Chlamydomonas sp. UWO 241]|nr:hypothetical protein FOA52_005968 [Chlamydomonas sp. UWO 241]